MFAFADGPLAHGKMQVRGCYYINGIAGINKIIFVFEALKVKLGRYCSSGFIVRVEKAC